LLGWSHLGLAGAHLPDRVLEFVERDPLLDCAYRPEAATSCGSEAVGLAAGVGDRLGEQLLADLHRIVVLKLRPAQAVRAADIAAGATSPARAAGQRTRTAPIACVAAGPSSSQRDSTRTESVDTSPTAASRSTSAFKRDVQRSNAARGSSSVSTASARHVAVSGATPRLARPRTVTRSSVTGTPRASG
jgi:hypothetical protein